MASLPFGRLDMAPKLCYVFIRKKEGCPFIDLGRSTTIVEIMHVALERRELLVDAYSLVFILGTLPDVAEKKFYFDMLDNVILTPIGVACLV